MRDPVIYRILRAQHHRTGEKWCIYPMYDFTHCLSDSSSVPTDRTLSSKITGPCTTGSWTRSRSTTPDRSSSPGSTQYGHEQAQLLMLVRQKLVSGWDDPRMPTISGMRRRGYTPESIRNFCERIGVAKNDSMVDVGLLEFCVREDLNRKAPRRMAVLNPLKIVIENYPEKTTEEFEIPNHPDDPSMGSRKVPFSRTVYIERDDFMEDPPAKFFRLAPGREVRLRGAYFITCTRVVKDEKTGEITELICTYDPATRGGDAPDGRKVKGTLHWVSASHSFEASVRLYDQYGPRSFGRQRRPGLHRISQPGVPGGPAVMPA